MKIIREPAKSMVFLVIGFSFGWHFRGEPPIQEVRATSLLVSEKPIHQPPRVPAGLLDRKVSELRVGESGWVSALHLRIDREHRVWVDPSASCLEQGNSFVPEVKVAKAADGLHLYAQKEAIAWTTLVNSNEEPDSGWLAFTQIHHGVTRNERKRR